jgi:hypothetical protein
MAEIKNYTLNFGYGRARYALNFALAKLAFTEIESTTALCNSLAKGVILHG